MESMTKLFIRARWVRGPQAAWPDDTEYALILAAIAVVV